MKIITIEDNEIKKCNQEIINADGEWVDVDDIIMEIDKLRADISNCIPKEFMVKFIDRFDMVSNALLQSKG